MMDKIIKILLDIKGVKISIDDDLTDRLNRQHSCSLLLVFSVLVSIRQYFGEAIHCWCPEQCASNHEKYANLYCWVEDTYYVPFFEKMPQQDDPKDQKISYYQWTPIVLLAQALSFFTPCLLWRVLNKRSGINISRIMEAAMSSQCAVYSENRDKTVRYAVLLLDRYLMAQRDHKRGCFNRIKHMLSKHCIFMCGRFYGNYLICCYVFVKLLYVINAIGQLFLLDIVLGYDYHMFGFHVIGHLLYGTPWHPSQRFPRVSLCDFSIRQNTNVHRYTVQCVLPINIFNEKIFIIVWFWFLILSIATFVSLMMWLVKSVYWPAQFRFIKRQLRTMDIAQRDNNMVRKFAENYLRRDGLFLMRLIAKNAGDLVATELLCGLWENFGSKQHRSLDGSMARCKKFNLARSAEAEREAAAAFQTIATSSSVDEV